MARMSIRKTEFKTWPEAREYIRVMTEEDTYKQEDFWSYKDGSGDATLVSEWDWAVVKVEWGVG